MAETLLGYQDDSSASQSCNLHLSHQICVTTDTWTGQGDQVLQSRVLLSMPALPSIAPHQEPGYQDWNKLGLACGAPRLCYVGRTGVSKGDGHIPMLGSANPSMHAVLDDIVPCRRDHEHWVFVEIVFIKIIDK